MSVRAVPAPVTRDDAPGQRLADLVAQHAQCADSDLDPDEWFPISPNPGKARLQAAAAIAVCASCQVRGPCLELSLRHWDIGKHGIWGGLLATDRARLHHWLPASHTTSPPPQLAPPAQPPQHASSGA